MVEAIRQGGPVDPYSPVLEIDDKMECGGMVCGGRLDVKCRIAQIIMHELQNGLDPEHPKQIKEEAVENLRTRTGRALHDCAFPYQLKRALHAEPKAYAEKGPRPDPDVFDWKLD